MKKLFLVAMSVMSLAFFSCENDAETIQNENPNLIGKWSRPEKHKGSTTVEYQDTIFHFKENGRFDFIVNNRETITTSYSILNNGDLLLHWSTGNGNQTSNDLIKFTVENENENEILTLTPYWINNADGYSLPFRIGKPYHVVKNCNNSVHFSGLDTCTTGDIADMNFNINSGEFAVIRNEAQYNSLISGGCPPSNIDFNVSDLVIGKGVSSNSMYDIGYSLRENCNDINFTLYVELLLSESQLVPAVTSEHNYYAIIPKLQNGQTVNVVKINF